MLLNLSQNIYDTYKLLMKNLLTIFHAPLVIFIPHNHSNNENDNTTKNPSADIK